MPKPFQYRSGALIYFQGDTADKVYILQKGKVSLCYQDIETNEHIRSPVQPGEFFGVKSAMGRYPHEENAMAMADTTILAFTIPEFEAMVMANTRIIMKMLKVFSNQMRRIHAQVSSLMEKEAVDPDAGLFNTGEYYLKNKRYSQAKYVFSRYLTYYPDGERAADAAKNLQAAEAALNANKAKAAAPPKAVVNDIIDDDPVAGAAESEEPAEPAPPGNPDLTKAYYDALSLFSQEKYKTAYDDFKKIVKENLDPEWTARSSYEMGRCLYFLNKYNECIKHYTAMLTQYPKHPDIKDAMFFIGQSNEKNGKKEDAAAFYKKIISMPALPEDGAIMAKTKRALAALEG